MNTWGQNGIAGVVAAAILAALGGIYRELRKGDSAQSRLAIVEAEMLELRAKVDRLTDRLDKAYVEIHGLKGDKAELLAINRTQEGQLALANTKIRELESQRDSQHEEILVLRKLNRRLQRKLSGQEDDDDDDSAADA